MDDIIVITIYFLNREEKTVCKKGSFLLQYQKDDFCFMPNNVII